LKSRQLFADGMTIPVTGKNELRTFRPTMQSNKKTQKESADWRFMLEQIGRELRKVYQCPERLPRRLRAAVAQLERKRRSPSGKG
jgi:hypothetical protein